MGISPNSLHRDFNKFPTHLRVVGDALSTRVEHENKRIGVKPLRNRLTLSSEIVLHNTGDSALPVVRYKNTLSCTENHTNLRQGIQHLIHMRHICLFERVNGQLSRIIGKVGAILSNIDNAPVLKPFHIVDEFGVCVTAGHHKIDTVCLQARQNTFKPVGVEGFSVRQESAVHINSN